MDKQQSQLRPEFEHLLASDHLNAALNILMKTATNFAKQKAESRYLRILKNEAARFLKTQTSKPLIRIIYFCDKLLKEVPSYKQPIAKVIQDIFCPLFNWFYETNRNSQVIEMKTTRKSWVKYLPDEILESIRRNIMKHNNGYDLDSGFSPKKIQELRDYYVNVLKLTTDELIKYLPRHSYQSNAYAQPSQAAPTSQMSQPRSIYATPQHQNSPEEEAKPRKREPAAQPYNPSGVPFYNGIGPMPTTVPGNMPHVMSSMPPHSQQQMMMGNAAYMPYQPQQGLGMGPQNMMMGGINPTPSLYHMYPPHHYMYYPPHPSTPVVYPSHLPPMTSGTGMVGYGMHPGMASNMPPNMPTNMPPGMQPMQPMQPLQPNMQPNMPPMSMQPGMPPQNGSLMPYPSPNQPNSLLLNNNKIQPQQPMNDYARKQMTVNPNPPVRPYSSPVYQAPKKKVELTVQQKLQKLKSLGRYRCPRCGLQSSNRENFDVHINQHFEEAKRKYQFSKKDSRVIRAQLQSLESWVSSIQQTEEQQCYLEIDKVTDNCCKLCSNTFTQSWDPRIEKWVYKDVVQVEINNKIRTVMHFSCFNALQQQQNSAPNQATVN